MVKKYRKKPVVIEAILYTGENAKEIAKWMKSGNSPITHKTGLAIFTAEGQMTASVGDYIIKEPFPTSDRKFYPCKPSIFENTYEEV